MRFHFLRPAGWMGLKRRYTLCGRDSKYVCDTSNPDDVTCGSCNRSLVKEGLLSARA